MATETAAVPITATPEAGQSVEHNGKVFKTIKEGSAYILVPPNAQNSVDPLRALAQDGSESQNVFYNPVQQFNRDLSVLAIKAFGEDMCQKKFQKHDQFSAKKAKKAERKRKTKEGGTHQEGGHDAQDAAGEPVPTAVLVETSATAGAIESATVTSGQKRKRDQDEQNEEIEEGKAKIQRLDDGSIVAGSEVAESSTVATSVDLLAGTSNGRKRKRSEDQQTEDGEEVVSKARKSMDVTSEAQGKVIRDSEATEASTPAATINEVEAPDEQNQAANGTNGVSADSGEAQIGNGPSITTNQPNGKQNTDWKPRFRILDALSASGLRALRYASEISFATEVVANDREKNAVKSINMNVQHNKLSSSIRATHSDAIGHMYSVAYPPANSHGPGHVSSKYDVVDLDPYGTAAPFIDAALQALEDGGMLCVTSTDSGVFASCGYSEKTFALYGGMPIKGLHSHEGGLRLLLHSIATTASKYGLAIEPLLSLSIDFYVRIFIRVRKSPADVKFLAGKTMIVYDCDHGCGAWTTQFIGRHQKHKNSDTNWKYSIAPHEADRHCEHCGSKMHIAGPMWGGPLHNPAFIEKMFNDLKYADPEVYQTKPRIEGMLDTALDELIVFSDTMDLREGPLPANAKTQTRDLVPRTPPEVVDHHSFFFIPSALCKVIKAIAPPEHLVKGALRHAGYKATRSHCRPGSIKTNAPWDVIWEIMREWVRQKSPIKEGAVKEGQAGWKILQAMRKDPALNPDELVIDGDEENENGKMKVVFDPKLGRDKPGKRMVRYQENPKENWGPMRKARGTA